MYKYIIEGNRPLSGKIKAGGNKNAALPCLCAALLTDQKVVLRNIPEIEDVKVMMNVMRELGVEIEKIEDGVFALEAKNISTVAVPREGASLQMFGVFLEISSSFRISTSNPASFAIASV